MVDIPNSSFRATSDKLISLIKATNDPLSEAMQAMKSRLRNKPTSNFHKAVRNSTIISTDASKTLVPASRIDSRINRARW